MTTWPLVQQGQTSESARSVQFLVNGHGGSLATDGVFGPLTKAAVQSFQSAHGLADDGIVGPLTWPALIIEVRMGSNGPAVSGVQSQIHSRIQRPDVDGIFGPDTNEVVTALQQAASLVVDGIVGPNTWQALVAGVMGATSAEQASQLLFAAWAANDAADADKIASPNAVGQIFARPSSDAPSFAFDGCSGAAGSVGCTWLNGSSMLTILSNDNLGVPFFFATEVTFS
jgi:peptidoglycan hydrolase-like protein with peptidoglycan-binding domain